jgi:hypothetical protein
MHRHKYQLHALTGSSIPFKGPSVNLARVLCVQYLLSKTTARQLSMLFYCLVYARELNPYNNRHAFIAAQGSKGVLECIAVLRT